MKRFFIGLLIGIASAAITVYFLIYRNILKKTDVPRRVAMTERYNDKIKDLANAGILTIEISKQKEAEVKREVFTEERDVVVSRFKSNFRTHR